MVSTPRPDTTNRDKLLKALVDQGVPNDVLKKIVQPMAGKTQEEKEQIAEQIMKKQGLL